MVIFLGCVPGVLPVADLRERRGCPQTNFLQLPDKRWLYFTVHVVKVSLDHYVAGCGRERQSQRGRGWPTYYYSANFCRKLELTIGKIGKYIALVIKSCSCKCILTVMKHFTTMQRSTCSWPDVQWGGVRVHWRNLYLVVMEMRPGRRLSRRFGRRRLW